MGIGGLADALGLTGAGGTDSTVPPSAQWVIKVDGQDLPPEIDDLVERVVVDQAHLIPAYFELVIRDYRRKVLTEAKIEIGSTIDISTTPPGGTKPEPLFFGEVTSIAAEYDVLGMRVVVRGFDLLHRLAAGRKTKVFKNATVADVVAEVAKAAGLEADTAPTGAAHDHVVQANQSDLEFLRHLAARVNFDLRIDRQKLHFGKEGDAGDAPGAADGDRPKPTQLVWSDNLLEFRGRISAVSQVKEVNVRGWDVTGKQAVIGKAAAETSSASVQLKPEALAKKVQGETLVVVDRPVGDQRGADDLAAAIAAQVASAAFEATAVAVGSPALKAGAAVSISDVDPSLAGDYVITKVRHVLGSADPYRSELEFTGRQDRSIHGLLANGTGQAPARASLPGVVIGIVSDNNDPDGLGRVKVKFPWLADDVASTWARVATIGAGKRKGEKAGHGIAWIPEPDEEVLVAFMHGDVNFPVVVGSLWNGVDTPPTLVDGAVDEHSGEVKKVGVVSRKGHGLILHDSEQISGLVLGTASGPMLGIDDKEQSIILECNGRKIELKTTGDLVLKAGGKVSIEAGSTLDMNSTGPMTIRGSKVGIN